LKQNWVSLGGFNFLFSSEGNILKAMDLTEMPEDVIFVLA
jgi:hypothetical protein